MKKLNTTKGITLIALAITIVVLLILAGVSIAMLTGEDGIIKEANNAKTNTEKANWEEQIDNAIISAEAKNRDTKLKDVIQELINKGVINSENDVNKENGTITTKAPSYEIGGKLDDYLGNSGEGEKPTDQGTLGTVTGTEKTNTTVKDKLENQVVVPAGFKVVNPTETVPDGIIIEDVSHEASQFVWIPVGTVKKADGQTETVILDRYTFDETGQETEQGDKAIAEQGYNFKELATSDKGNITAKNLEDFKTKASKGYYIGRYEARTGVSRTNAENELTQITEKPDDYVYNYVTQPQAADLSQKMYNDRNFESDLVNSYAWDTAIIFLQKFDNRENKTKPYSMQNSLNTTLATQGTNKLSTQDKICNIFDMASNTSEWTTETIDDSINPCVSRGGFYLRSSRYTSVRGNNSTRYSYDCNAFRPLLYL